MKFDNRQIVVPNRFSITIFHLLSTINNRYRLPMSYIIIHVLQYHTIFLFILIFDRIYLRFIRFILVR